MRKILFIEDDLSLAAAYRAKLAKHFQTAGALTGDEGIEQAASWKPDIILLDLFLPGRSGFEVLKELKKNEKTKQIPVLVLTNLEGQCDTVIKGGAEECFIKTETSMDTIVTKIEQYLK